MAIAEGDVIRVALQWLVDGSDLQVNTHTFQVHDIGTPDDDLEVMEILNALLASDVYNNVVAQMSNNLVGSIMTGKNLTQNYLLPTVANNIDGTHSVGETHAYQVSALVYLNGVQPRRQGRMYLPVFTGSALNDNGDWDAGTLTALLAFAADILLPLVGVDASFTRVVSNLLGTNWFVPSFAGVSAAPRTQRRRTKGRGG